MGRAGVERARRHFDERRVVDIVLDTYEVVARAKRIDLAFGVRPSAASTEPD